MADDITVQIAGISEQLKGLGRDIEGLSRRVSATEIGIQGVGQRLSDQQRPNWQLLLSLLSLGAIGLGGLYAVVTLQIRNETTTLVSDVKAISQSVNDVGARVGRLAESNGANSADIRGLRAWATAVVAEIETQMCGSADIANMRAARHSRETAMLWERSGLGRYPDAEFYPAPGRCKSAIENGG